MSKNIAILELQVKDHEAYYNAHSEALDWVRKTRIAVQQCGDPHGEKQSTLEKERKMSNIASSLNIGEFTTNIYFYDKHIYFNQVIKLLHVCAPTHNFFNSL